MTDNTEPKNRCGYLGPRGTFSEMAVLNYEKFCDKIIPYKTIREVVENVRQNNIERGIIPLENSQEGSVNISLDLLLDKSDLKIIDEVIIPIEHFLLAEPDTVLDDIEEIYSHPQALAQSGDFVYEHLPDVELKYTDSTASAAQKIRGRENSAMIGSRRISEIYPLEILAENIEGELKNQTRFVVLARECAAEDVNKYKPHKKYKTSIICAPEVNRPGVLHEILSAFAERNIDLTRIESRPTKKKLGEYLFYIDLAGHQEQCILKNALIEVKNKCGLFKILGSYQCAEKKSEEDGDRNGRKKAQ